MGYYTEFICNLEVRNDFYVKDFERDMTTLIKENNECASLIDFELDDGITRGYFSLEGKHNDATVRSIRVHGVDDKLKFVKQ